MENQPYRNSSGYKTHTTPCAQSRVTTLNALNYFHLCVPVNVYMQYTNKPYPDIPADSGPWDGADEDTALARLKAKAD